MIMNRILYSRPLARKLWPILLASIITIGLLSMVTTNVFAGAVNVYDFAGVLNKSQVSNEASSLSYAMDIYTTNTFNGSQQQFASETDGKINQSNKVVMAIDVRNHYVYLDGKGVSLSRSQYQDAANAFSSSYRSNQDYTDATIAAIDELRGNANSGNTGFNGYAPGGNSFGTSTLCCIGLLVLAGLAVFGVFRSRRRGAGFFNRGPVAPPYDPYNQGPYPPNYGPGYNQGVNPWAAGGIGAAGGGLLGYELGKEQGEREERDRDGFDQGGYFGGDNGGAGANFGGDNNGGGGGAGADFGGGNNGGGDWGGGGSDNGGGGGGGGDNGGGAGSNF
jgi:hypothetical protein